MQRLWQIINNVNLNNVVCSCGRAVPNHPGLASTQLSATHPASQNHLNLWIYYYVLIQLHAACTCGHSPSRSSHPHWPRRAAGSSFGTLADILHPLASTASLRLHATHTSSHTCVLKHWQQLLWNCLGLYSFFLCVFIWRLKHIAYIKLP